MTVCAIITCSGDIASAQACLHHLMQQTRKPDRTILLTDRHALSPCREKLLTDYASIGLTISCTETAVQWDSCFELAFQQHGASHIWLLDTESTPAPHALENLLDNAGGGKQIPVSLMIVPDRENELSMPVFVENGGNLFAPWKSILHREALPTGRHISLRGAWWGALYPKEVYTQLGAPKSTLTLNGGNEEYAWQAKLAGFQFSLVKDSVIRHPFISRRLIHYKIGGRSFFYECGLPPELRYYKIRNWAWIQRLRKPRKPLLRLMFCGFYIILALNAMLKCGEFRPQLVYDLFRALHNGFYGKLRPYSGRKN